MILDGWIELGETMIQWYKRWRAKRIEDPKLRAKTLAELDKEPWVDVVSIEFADPSNPGSGYFELDWNDAFVASLNKAGYSGRTDEAVVDMWFNDLCRGVIGDNIK